MITAAKKRELYDSIKPDALQGKSGSELEGIVKNVLVELEGVDATEEPSVAATVGDVRKNLDSQVRERMEMRDSLGESEDEAKEVVYRSVLMTMIYPMFDPGQPLDWRRGGRKHRTRRRRGGTNGKTQRQIAKDLLEGKENVPQFPSAEGEGKGFQSLAEMKAARERAKELEALRAMRPVSRPSSPTLVEGARRRKTRRGKKVRRVTRKR